MLLQKTANAFSEYLGTCCLINISPEMQELSPKSVVLVINLACDSSISNRYFFQREVIDLWSTEISVTMALLRSIGLLKKEYVIKNMEEINDFLFNYRYLLDIP
jgi:hypothetical protein